ncbi:hypothetical protein MRX96_010885 [Rhipicephalus microplus]
MIIQRFLVVNHRGTLNGTSIFTHLRAPTAHGCGEIRRSSDGMRAANRVECEIEAPCEYGSTRRSQAVAAKGGVDNIPGAITQASPGSCARRQGERVEKDC